MELITLEDVKKQILFFQNELTRLNRAFEQLSDKFQLSSGGVYDVVESLVNQVNNMQQTVDGMKRTVDDHETRISTLETGQTDLGNRITTEIQGAKAYTDIVGKNVTTTAQNYSDKTMQNFLSQYPMVKKINNICRLLYQVCYYPISRLGYQNTASADKNGFIRYSCANDRIVSISPYDSRVTSYDNIVVGWTDYQGDSQVNIQGKWMSNWSNVSGLVYRIWLHDTSIIRYENTMNTYITVNDIKVPP